MFYYLGPFVWYSTPYPHWGPPVDARLVIDLRSHSQCALRGTPHGFGLFESASDLGSDYENLGADPRQPWSEQSKARWSSALRLPRQLSVNNLSDAIWETRTVQADPTGEDRIFPI